MLTTSRIDLDEVERAAEKNGAQLSYYSLDVTDEKAVTEQFAKFIPKLRYPLRGLVACAGLSLDGPATDFPASKFRRILDINVTGTFLVTQAVANELVRTDQSGSIVLVASMSGYVSNKVSSDGPPHDSLNSHL